LYRTTQTTAEGAILRHTVLKAIANQLSQATVSDMALSALLTYSLFLCINTADFSCGWIFHSAYANAEFVCRTCAHKIVQLWIAYAALEIRMQL